jgi:hypothetical protein
MLGAMMEYRALEEAVSMLKKYGRVCRRLEGLGLAVRESWEVERALRRRGIVTSEKNDLREIRSLVV